ncbi:MAG: metallophosphoesterase [Lentisphaeraceae bacterium]|nr:metallophosphoesterase [Lentisphaeraceae bacterium]
MSSKKVRTLLVGDIHGCYRELKELLKKVSYDPLSDRLISLGDLVHKGPKAWKVLKFFYENNLEVVMGNHDWHFLEFLKGNKKTYPEAEKILLKCEIDKPALIEWMSTFPFYIESDDFIAVHAGFNPDRKKFSNTSNFNMMTARYFDTKNLRMISSTKVDSHKLKPWYHEYPPEKIDNKITVFGHWAQPLPRVYKNFRCIDTGCCYGGNLSCLVLPEDKIVKVPSQQKKKFNY